MRHYAEYLLPGFMFPEETVRALDAHDPQEALAKAPEGSYCFTLYDTEEPVDLGPDYRVIPKARNRSGRYYIGGTIYNIIQLEAMPEHSTVLANMHGNHWEEVICCRTGNWQPFTDEDVLLEETANA